MADKLFRVFLFTPLLFLIYTLDCPVQPTPLNCFPPMSLFSRSHPPRFSLSLLANSLLQIEMDSFRPAYFCVCLPYLYLHAKGWRWCLEKGFPSGVMVITKIPFQMWLKFCRNQQGFIGVMTLQVPVTNFLSPFATSPPCECEVVPYPSLLFFEATMPGYSGNCVRRFNHLSVLKGQLSYLFMTSDFTRSYFGNIVITGWMAMGW